MKTPIATREGTILLVEDNRDDETLTVTALREAGISNPIDIARDGYQALQRLRDTAKPVPILTLMDLKLPRLDGLEVLRQLRSDERLCLVPVIVLTSSQQDDDVVTSYQLGANSYVRKPVDFDQFRAAMRGLGLFWLVINVPPVPVVAPS